MNSDSYANAYDTGASQTGMTNQWLEARNNTQFFTQRFGDFPHFDQQVNGSNQIHHDMIRTQIAQSPLSDAFFADGNVQLLKQLLADGVNKQSEGAYKISAQAQSTQSMLTVMTSIFMEHARHLPNDVSGQVVELNRLVLNDIVPRVMTNIKMELTHRRDRAQQPLTMDRPRYMSQAGTRSNQSISAVFL